MVMRVCRLCGEKFCARADVDYCSTAHRQAAYRNRHKAPARPTVAVPASVEEKLALIARLVAEVRELTTYREVDHIQGAVATGWAPSGYPDGTAKSRGAERV